MYLNRLIKFFVFLLAINLPVQGYEKDPADSAINIKNEGIDFTKTDASSSIKKMLDDIQNMTPGQYPEKIAQFRETFENYVEYKKGICGGTFATAILDDKGVVKQGSGPSKLSKEERSLCIKELKEMQISFINNMYHIRKKYLDSLHEARINEIKMIKDNAINEIMKSYGKK